MALTTYGRILDDARRGEAAIDRAREVVGDDPGTNARLDSVSDNLGNARDTALIECLGSPGLLADPGGDCAVLARNVTKVADLAVYTAGEYYRRATGHELAADAPEVLPIDAGEPGAPGGVDAGCPFDGKCRAYALGIGAALGALVGALV